jgi:hypothetical protein
MCRDESSLVTDRSPGAASRHWPRSGHQQLQLSVELWYTSSSSIEHTEEAGLCWKDPQLATRVAETQTLSSDTVGLCREEDVADVILLVLGVLASGSRDGIVVAEELLQLVDGGLCVEICHPDDAVLGCAGLDGEVAHLDVIIYN